MKPYAELLEFNQPNHVRKEGFTRIRDQFPLIDIKAIDYGDHGYYHADPERISEFAGRWDYGNKNAEKLGQPAKDGTPIIQKWIGSGEQSMLEMAHATVFIECSRVVSHELIRHRLASYQQESQRFTLQVLSDEDFYMPEEMGEWKFVAEGAYRTASAAYEELIGKGVPKQIARYVLPNATRTRMIVSANLREWRHIIKLRLHSSAQPEMRELMQQIYDQLVEVFPQSLEGVLEEGRGVR